MPLRTKEEKQTTLQGKTVHFSSVFTKAVGTPTDNFVVIEGYASTINQDRSGDIIDSTVWTKPKALDNYKKNPIVLAYHDFERPIGTCESLSIDPLGLKVRVKVFKDADPVVFDMIQEGVLKAFSVGFRLMDLDYDEEVEAFMLTELELFEISIVSVPDNQDSLFDVAKSIGMERKDLKNLLVGDIIVPSKPKEINMTPEELQALVAKQLADAKAEDVRQKAIEAAKAAEREALVASITKEVTASVSSSGAEKLIADLQLAFDTEKQSMSETIKQFQSQIEDKSSELLALSKSKMVHGVGENSATTAEERGNAVLLAKILRKNIEDTTYGKNLRAKAAGFNSSNAAVSIPGQHTVNAGEWETEFMTTFYKNIRRDLVIEPLFRVIQMNTATMRVPIVPEQGYASYIAVNQLGTTASTGTPSSGNRPTELTMIAHKLAASDTLGMEEDEDTILPILPIIGENIARRMAKSSDRSLLRGVGASAADPIKGLAQYAIAAGRTTTISLASAKLTALKLQQTRRSLGIFGMRASDVVYIISTQGYYDLLEDVDMRKYFDVGPNNATLLTGEVARINGSPILVSDEFDVVASGNVAALVVNMRNFLMGSLRGMTMKSDVLVGQDTMLLTATRRFAMLEMEAGAVAAITYVA